MLMDECWLKPNRRAVGPLVAIPLLIAAAGLASLGWGWFATWPAWTLVLAGLAAGSGAIATIAIVRWAQRPRLAYRDGELLVYLGAAEPQRVPIDVVEVFFRGQSDVPIAALQHAYAKTANVIVRLAEAEPQWHRRDIPPAFGKWAEGYIILSGTWCEPITLDLLRQLNGRLAAVHRARRGCSTEQCPGTGEPCGTQTACPGTGEPCGTHAACPGTGEPCGSHATCPGSGEPCSGLAAMPKGSAS
jgi:hypothetical protein